MKLQLKRSNVIESGAAKEPTASQLEYGELAINYNTTDPAIFLKDSNNNVIRISGVHNIADDGQVELPASTTPPLNPDDGNLWYNSDDGRLYIYYNDGDSAQWVDASPDSWDPSSYPDVSDDTAQPNTLDDRYLMLNAANSPVTGTCEFSDGVQITGGVNISPGIGVDGDGRMTFRVFPQSEASAGALTLGGPEGWAGNMQVNMENVTATGESLYNFQSIGRQSSGGKNVVLTQSALTVDTESTGNMRLYSANVNVAQTGGVDATLIGYYSNVGQSSLAQGEAYAFYGAGDAQSYFGGNVGIGVLPSSRMLDVGGSARVGAPGDGNEILNLNLERAWSFYQKGSGAASRLDLRCSSNKAFDISGNQDGTNIVALSAHTSNGKVVINGATPANVTNNETLTVNGNTVIGGSNISNYLFYRGVVGDEPGSTRGYHTFIGERLFDNTDDKSELVLFKGNDAANSNYDRIRHIATGKHQFDIRTGTTIEGNPDTACDSADNVKILEINNAGIKLQQDMGIEFHAHGAGTDISSNTLDDFEKGAWTPRFTSNNANFNITQTGYGVYTKIGNFVQILGTITVTAASNTEGSVLRIRDLPFKAANLSSNQCGSGEISVFANLNVMPHSIRVEKNTNDIVLETSSLTSGQYKTDQIKPPNLSGNTSLRFSISYISTG